MGSLVYFCAGTSVDVLPGRTINALLLNVPNNAENDKKIMASINLIKYAQPKFTMLDSGGFQLHQAQRNGVQIIYDESAPIFTPGIVNMTPSHLIPGAVRLKPNYMVGLDFPIRTIREREKQEVEFRYKLGFNVDWAIKTAQLRQKYCPDVRLLIPVQCYSLEHLHLFVKLIGDISYDGFSMPTRNLNLAQIAAFLLEFYKMGIRNVHILGTLKFFTIGLCAYSAHHLFNWVSLDATNWRKKAEFQSYASPYDLSQEYIGQDVVIDEALTIDCQCPWCIGKSFTYIRDLPYTEKTSFLRCHNHWVTERICRELYQNAANLGNLKKYLLKASSHPEKVDKAIQIISTLDIYKDLEISCALDFLSVVG